ncbi:hypothetical protein BN1184_BM_00440 [Pantoea ananatis]|nr:hypothetical protein BN1184_BM_00440 [Pantoea ananatis]
MSWSGVITANTREDNVASATARRARRQPSHPPGCTILRITLRLIFCQSIKAFLCIRSSAG